MLSVANVRSPSAAASYFAADNYYAKADADRSGQWVGKGADLLGLKGRVETRDFDAVLRGELPDGTSVGNPGQPHRPGTDMTFSLPKSWSLLALVGKDERIIEAYREAVVEALQWAEKNAAETRLVERGKVRTVATGNLTVGLFQHDTNRNQEPNLHFHAVVANVTQGPEGKWRTLKNDQLWSLGTLLNSMAMARFRLGVEKLGYEAGPVGKHGNFEARGITREQVMAFSTRRKEVLEARRGPGLEAGKVAALATRAAKLPIADRAALGDQWQASAKAIGLDLPRMVEVTTTRGNERAALDARPPNLIERGLSLLRDFAARVRGEERDPLVPDHVLKQGPEAIAAAQAVASAVRHLSQREAGFPREAFYKAALDFGLPTTIAHVEKAVRSLVRSGELVKGRGAHKGWLASREEVDRETRILAWANEGKGAVEPILSDRRADASVQASALVNQGFQLNEGQLGAARLILTSRDRTIAVQGIAGAGKSSVLKPVADVLREEGHKVLGLAVQNTLVQMLERDTGIEAKTLASFLKRWGKLAEGAGMVGVERDAREELKGSVLVLDEASMVSNADKEQLIRIANRAGAHRLVLVGDRKQLGAVDAGKPFDLLQKGGIGQAEMTANLRGRDPVLRSAQAAAQAGLVHTAFEHLKASTIKTTGDGAIVAAERWLALSPDERERTAIYASGRKIRSAVNAAVQTGLAANGEIGPEKVKLDVLDRVNLTREELRYIAAYRPGMVLEVARAERALGLGRGEYSVRKVDDRKELVELQDARGKLHRLKPSRIGRTGKEDNLTLFDRRLLDLHKGDRIRWTRNDHSRGLFNADQAKVSQIDDRHVTIQTSKGIERRLGKEDPMLRRVDLAYALNAHMAQGLTSDRGIAVMDSRERNLANQKTFLVTVTRLRDQLTLVVDSAAKLGAAVSRNQGDKSSALEVTRRLKEAAQVGVGKASPEQGPKASEKELGKERTRNIDFSI
ncbi:conjugative relaxase [Erythrobacter litoralis]|uniref:MobF family relaxase n=1 Tax=Erythrobacter litoralis TaxID=39960 RepID=UPI002435A094|nr:MobF family relaxase [Erythrobacter litoralis]MDG6079922.1 conjugative relaxase [Erythrobacter litoralis]